MSLEALRAHRRKTLDLAERHGARNVRVFGSTVRGDAGPDSDIDFLVEVERGRTLLDVIALEQDLEELLGRSVEVLQRNSHRSRSAVKDDRVYLQHIRDALDDITTHCGSDRDGFFSDRMRQDATLRKLDVVGHAVKNLSEPTKSRRPEIPWKQMRTSHSQDGRSVAAIP